MKKEILEALKGSIKKWEKIVDGTGVDLRTQNCDLCILFGDRCVSDIGICPVFERTGEWQCNGSPYYKWADHQFEVHNKVIGRILCPTCKELAQAELDFLKGLLPEGEADDTGG